MKSKLIITTISLFLLVGVALSIPFLAEFLIKNTTESRNATILGKGSYGAYGQEAMILSDGTIGTCEKNECRLKKINDTVECRASFCN